MTSWFRMVSSRTGMPLVRWISRTVHLQYHDLMNITDAELAARSDELLFFQQLPSAMTIQHFLGNSTYILDLHRVGIAWRSEPLTTFR